MQKLFNRTDTATAKQTFRLFVHEIVKDKRRLTAYSLLYPISRLLYVVLLPLLFSMFTQSLVQHPHDLTQPMNLLIAAGFVSLAAVITAYYGTRILFDHEEHL